MDLHTYGILFRIEETHWWHSARRKIVLDWIKERYAGRTGLSILDAGCGTGLLMQELSSLGTVEGIDISEEALDFCRRRGLTNVQRGDVTQLPFASESFDLVTAMDILEHLDDDTGALREWRRVLKPGGRVILFVPAHRWLWSLQDEVSHHRRRYTYRTLRAAIQDSGLEIERQSYVSTFLFPVIFLGRQWLKVRLRFQTIDTENDLHPTWSNGILRRVFQSEIPVLRRMNMPFGASLVAVARKAA